MAKSHDETSPTEPIEPVETPVAEQPTVAAEPAPAYEAAPVTPPVAGYVPPPVAPAKPLHSTEDRVVLIIGLVALAFVLAMGVFATGVAVGRHMNAGAGGRFGMSRPGMMQGYGVYTFVDGSQLKGQWDHSHFTGASAATP